MSPSVRTIAVVLDGPPTPAWQARALAGLRDSPLLHVVEVRLTGATRQRLARRLHAALERRLLRLGADALAPVQLDGSPAAEAPAGAGAELVVWLSQQQPPVQEARDVLYLRHERRRESLDDAFKRARSGGLGSVESDVLLRRGDGATVVVERTVSGARAFSLTLSRDQALWKLAAVVRRAAERAPGLALAEPPPATASAAPSDTALIAGAALSWPRVLVTRALFRRPWSMRVRRRGSAPTEGWSQVSEHVRWAPGHLYADPFLFEHEGRHHLFCEEVPRGGGRAVISHTELAPDGGLADRPRCVLSQPYHLSYPFVFAHEGETFMIPETSAVSRVELYRATEFPHSWTREAILLEGIDAADATVLAHGDRLWLFVAVAAADASSLDELHLFSASALRGPWRAHPRNPVVSDARRARPAGAIQRWGSRMVRPGQDGSRRYGGAIAFCEIDVLNESEYAEHEIARLQPGDLGDARATHTYTADRVFEAIDLRRREPRLSGLIGRSRA